MTGIIKEHRKSNRLGRRGLSATMAVVVLGAVVVATGAAGFVVLSVESHSTSSTQQTCSPSGSPQCDGNAHTATGFVGPRLTIAAA